MCEAGVQPISLKFVTVHNSEPSLSSLPGLLAGQLQSTAMHCLPLLSTPFDCNYLNPAK